jgi:hypothetical protein
MTPSQIQHVRDNNTVAAIVTTRNATFWLVDSKGNPGPAARYELVEWDDANELCVLKAGVITSQTVNLSVFGFRSERMFPPSVYRFYGIDVGI